MNTDTPIIEIKNLTRRYGKLDAVNGLSLTIRAGRCYGFFGRNGAGKTTTIKCLLNLLRPNSGTARVFGLDPQKNEVAVKSRLAYVPDMVAFYPWMTVRGTLEYFASFRQHWNREIEADLLKRFQLDPNQKASNLSRGQKTQLALIGATVFFLATFATALWSTLLLRQVAAALWITLLVPVTLFAWAVVSMVKYSDTVLALAICAVTAPLFLVGFWWARRLFFRAQDVGWSGGVISLPDWPFSAALPGNMISPRNRKPIFALMKKEFQLQQVSLMGAVGLLALHIGIIALRKYHQFARDSAGEVVTCIFWILWLVMPVIIGCMAVAEERSLGVMEGQLCHLLRAGFNSASNYL
jgi:ABC-type transport system involved in cytochrome c biogenesis ATPase subunit